VLPQAARAITPANIRNAKTFFIINTPEDNGMNQSDFAPPFEDAKSR
jgi:hypothetical protein